MRYFVTHIVLANYLQFTHALLTKWIQTIINFGVSGAVCPLFHLAFFDPSLAFFLFMQSVRMVQIIWLQLCMMHAWRAAALSCACNEPNGCKVIVTWLTTHLNGGPLLAAKTGPLDQFLKRGAHFMGEYIWYDRRIPNYLIASSSFVGMSCRNLQKLWYWKFLIYQVGAL